MAMRRHMGSEPQWLTMLKCKLAAQRLTVAAFSGDLKQEQS